jgi:hypothetical protein
MDEPRFLGGIEDLERNAGLSFDPSPKIDPVFRFADRRRRDRADALRTALARGLDEAANRIHAPVHRFGRKPAAFECIVAAQPNHFARLMHDARRVVNRIALDEDEVNRVRPDIDRGEKHARRYEGGAASPPNAAQDAPRCRAAAAFPSEIPHRRLCRLCAGRGDRGI